jgi:hypothetical protein
MSLKEVRSIPILFYLMKNGNWTLEELVDAWDKILVASIALHWVPIPMPMGFGWAWVQCYCSWVGMGFVHPCIQLQIGVKLLGCMEYANQEALRVEVNDSEQLFLCLIQSRLNVGGLYTFTQF